MNPESVPRLRYAGSHLPVAAAVSSIGQAYLLLAPPTAHAQSDADDSSAATGEEADVSDVKLTPDEAARVLAQALPDAPDARYGALQRQFRAVR